MMRPLVCMAAASLLLTLPACVKPVKYGEAIELAYRPTTIYEPGLATTEAVSDTKPSVTGFARENWTPTLVHVSPEPPLHQPIYTWSYQSNTSEARNTGRYPTGLSSLDTTTDQAIGDQFIEGILAPLVAASDIVLFIPRAIRSRPGKVVEGGLEPYERVPRRPNLQSKTPDRPNPPADRKP